MTGPSCVVVRSLALRSHADAAHTATRNHFHFIRQHAHGRSIAVSVGESASNNEQRIGELVGHRCYGRDSGIWFQIPAQSVCGSAHNFNDNMYGDWRCISIGIRFSNFAGSMNYPLTFRIRPTGNSITFSNPSMELKTRKLIDFRNICQSIHEHSKMFAFGAIHWLLPPHGRCAVTFKLYSMLHRSTQISAWLPNISQPSRCWLWAT